MNLEEFEASLASPLTVYLVKQGQSLALSHMRELMLAQIAESAHTFDWSEFDLAGGDSELDVISAAQTLPWISLHRWLWVRSAQEAGDGLLDYLKSPNPRSVMILEFGGRKPSKWPRLPLVETGQTDPIRWLIVEAENEGFHLERAAASSLVELVGDELTGLRGELEKLLLYRFDDKQIRRQDVLDLCVQTRDSDVFDLVSALASRRTEQALIVIDRLLESGIRLPQVLAILYWNFRRLIVARELMLSRRPFDQIVRELKIWSYRNQRRSLEAVSRERLIELLLKLKKLEIKSKTGTVQEREMLEAFVVDVCLAKSL